MSRWVTVFAIATSVAACEPIDDYPPECPMRPDAGPMYENTGFIQPTEITQAYAEVGGAWALQGAANYSCLYDDSEILPTTVDVTLTGRTRDVQTSDLVGNVDITVFTEGDPLTAPPITTANSDVDSRYSLTVPVGTGLVTVLMTDPETQSRFVDSIVFHYTFAPDAPSQSDDLFAVSHLTAAAFPAFVGVRRCPGFGWIYGHVVDCEGNEVDGAIVTVSATPRTADHLFGADTYYFSAGSTSLPVHHSRETNTNHDGMFGVANLPPTLIAYVQAWGYIEGQSPGVDDLTLLSEVRVAVPADAVGNAVLKPLRE